MKLSRSALLVSTTGIAVMLVVMLRAGSGRAATLVENGQAKAVLVTPAGQRKSPAAAPAAATDRVAPAS